MGWGGLALALPLALGLALGLVWASGGGGSSLLLSKWRGFFLGALGGVWVWGPWGGCPLPAGAVAAATAARAALAAAGLPYLALHPQPNLALRVHAPCTPPRLPPTRPLKHRGGHIGVIPQHPAQLGDLHEVRPASAIAPLHAHPAGVGPTCMHAHNVRTKTGGRCVLAAF